MSNFYIFILTLVFSTGSFAGIQPVFQSAWTEEMQVGCVDFTGSYKLFDPKYAEQQILELHQEGCERITQTMHGESGLVFGPITVSTDGVTRNVCSSDGIYCSQSKYIQTPSEFISEEIYSEYGIKTSLDKNKMVKLLNGDIKMFYNHTNYQSSSGSYSQEAIGKRLP